MSMHFRCVEITDFEQVTSFYKYVIENTEDMKLYARWVYGQHPTDEMIEKYIQQGAMYVLEDGDVIVAAMAVTMSQGDDYHSIQWSVPLEDVEVAVVHILCVNPDYQKQGIGKRMIQESVALAEEWEKKAVRLDALASNQPAHRMYGMLGFELRGIQNLYAENTGWTDFLFFEYVKCQKFGLN